MTGLAISLVLGAALIHASWNYLLKKSGGGIGFVWALAAYLHFRQKDTERPST